MQTALHHDQGPPPEFWEWPGDENDDGDAVGADPDEDFLAAFAEDEMLPPETPIAVESLPPHGSPVRKPSAMSCSVLPVHPDSPPTATFSSSDSLATPSSSSNARPLKRLRCKQSLDEPAAMNAAHMLDGSSYSTHPLDRKYKTAPASTPRQVGKRVSETQYPAVRSNGSA